MSDGPDRRPLASRNTGWARSLTRVLARTDISPNQISVASVVFATLAAAALWATASTGGPARIVLLIVAAACCQLRLLCNLMDGLVAIEAGKQAPDGPFWNEFPDRVADIVILGGLGLASGAPALGWAAAALAVFAAYTRELGHALVRTSDFRGPMAKPHRMALATLACLAATFEPLWHRNGDMLTAGLWIIVIGTAVTIFRRARGIVNHLGRR